MCVLPSSYTRRLQIYGRYLVASASGLKAHCESASCRPADGFAQAQSRPCQGAWEYIVVQQQYRSISILTADTPTTYRFAIAPTTTSAAADHGSHNNSHNRNISNNSSKRKSNNIEYWIVLVYPACNPGAVEFIGRVPF